MALNTYVEQVAARTAAAPVPAREVALPDVPALTVPDPINHPAPPFLPGDTIRHMHRPQDVYTVVGCTLQYGTRWDVECTHSYGGHNTWPAEHLTLIEG